MEKYSWLVKRSSKLIFLLRQNGTQFLLRRESLLCARAADGEGTGTRRMGKGSLVKSNAAPRRRGQSHRHEAVTSAGRINHFGRTNRNKARFGILAGEQGALLAKGENNLARAALEHRIKSVFSRQSREAFCLTLIHEHNINLRPKVSKIGSDRRGIKDGHKTVLAGCFENMARGFLTQIAL